MHGLPIIGRNHFDGIPGTAVEEGAVRAFAGALLATNAKIRIDFNAAEGWMIFVGHPEHAGFDWAVLDARGRAGATGATVGGDGEDARPLLSSGFAVAFRHGPILFYDIEHSIRLRKQSNEDITAEDTEVFAEVAEEPLRKAP